MKLSEKEALKKLVSLGLISSDVSGIIQRLARDKPLPIEEAEGPIVHPLILLLDKSGSIEDVKQSLISGQHIFINSVLGAASGTVIYFGQLLFNHEVEYFQDMTPFRDPKDARRAHPKVRFLNETDYTTTGTTALYDSIVRSLAMLAPFQVTAEELGQQVFAHIAIMTDGKDEDGKGGPGSKTTPDALKKVINFVTESGFVYRILMLGLGNFNYREIGRSIGLQDQDIIQVGCEPQAIREGVSLLSSRTAASISH